MSGPEAAGAAGHRELDPLAEQLVRSGGGDTSAFAELYEGVAPRVYGLVLRVIGDVHQSEEVSQEVFLQIWQTCDRFDPARGSALSWVMTIAHRRAVDRVRSSEASRRRDQAEVELGRPAPFDQTTATAEASHEAQRVRKAMAALSPAQRQALELAYFGGHTHREISQLLQVPLGTAKTRIRDGLIRLRDLLVPVGIEPA